jgi:quercetin dioxygenase-like cupin family protein
MHMTTEVASGMRYDEARQFLLATGLIARQLATHELAPRPKRNSRAVAFDELAGNTTLGIHLSEIAAGGDKIGHRHVDEAVIYIVTGHGWSELRQDDSKPMQRVEWEPGDLLSIPVNAWHQHFNHSAEATSRQLAFKNTRLLRRLFGSREFVYANDFRFNDRYADQDDYWTSESVAEDGRTVVNMIKNCPEQPLDPALELGSGVRRKRYLMAGQRMLDVELVEIEAGAHVVPHRSLAEEALFFLAGSGRCQVWDEAGNEQVIEWSAGDLLSPPFNSWRQYEAHASAKARYLLVRNNFIEVALGSRGIPNRLAANGR